ncbi:hypothetical protein H5410_003042 [Solanum commersonii]|uniref:Uncharacterized protein n=1 Tax=Solanum commersonii TaxID=4109 RepID=A0A9J6B3J9_SOLCO|nr:hypothetical protein H5410_003042 [Solanum commersonii]
MEKFGSFGTWTLIVCFLRKMSNKLLVTIGHNELQSHSTITFVYAKCKDQLRRPLWDKMMHHAADNTNPWCSVGYRSSNPERLDRALLMILGGKMPQTTITHLPYVGSRPHPQWK